MFDPENYTTIAAIFPRLLGLVYFFAIGAFIFQIEGLIGEKGILPISQYFKLLKKHNPTYMWDFPSLFWFKSSDRALLTVVILGTFCSLLLVGGIFPPLMLVILYLLHLSIVSGGQDFLSFGWEGFMLEVTAHAFLLSLTPVPNLMVWFSINFLLFRFHIQAGAVKLQSLDASWRNLTAIAVHYQTQPLPNTIAWYVYKWPMWFQKLSTLFMFTTELIIPFGIFGGECLRAATFICFFGLQYFIWLTGNFSYLNYLTIALSTILLGNHVLAWFGIPPSITEHLSPQWLTTLISLLGGLLLGLQALRFWYHFSPHGWMRDILNAVAPFHLANRYGIFAVMTRERYEIVIEGSEDGKRWQEYTFKYKPSEITRRPRRISPYQPRLDWQAWFLPFTDYSERWFQHFLLHLLKGTPEVLYLLRDNPFPNKPPKYVRSLMYEYEFSTSQEKREKGWWWKRHLIGFYSPVMTLKSEDET